MGNLPLLAITAGHVLEGGHFNSNTFADQSDQWKSEYVFNNSSADIGVVFREIPYNVPTAIQKFNN